MRGLKICLWLAGIACLSSAAGIFLPVSVWQTVTELFGAEQLPDSSVLEYAVRVMSATYVGIGVYLVILALRPMDYGILVPFTGLAAVVLGLVCMITGLVVSMPVLWFLGDSVPCIVLGILIFVFWQKAKQTSRPVNDTM